VHIVLFSFTTYLWWTEDLWETHGTMPADTLLDIAVRACCRISKRITDIGDIPYDLIRPVLIKVESPEQLV
jgi:hypothetical protein